LNQGRKLSGGDGVVADIGRDNVRRHLDDFSLFVHYRVLSFKIEKKDAPERGYLAHNGVNLAKQGLTTDIVGNRA
jgi:hypothetical protein